MKVQRLWFDDSRIYIILDDGREGSLPIRLYPALYNATQEQRENYKFSNFGIHWEDIDEDLSYEGFFVKENQPKSNNMISKIFFEFPELNVRQVARSAGINPTLMQQYVDGHKNPSETRTRQIIEALNRLGKELMEI